MHFQNPNYFIQKMYNLGLFNPGTFALDIGCGEGNDSLFLASKGYLVDSIDVVCKSEHTYKNVSVNFIKDDVQSFPFDKNKYDLIIANDILPFLPSKEIVESILIKLINSLVPNGKIYFTIFGPKDDLNQRKDMSFFEFEEVLGFLENLDLHLYHCCTEKGYGPTTDGKNKIWQKHKFLCIKKDQNSYEPGLG